MVEAAHKTAQIRRQPKGSRYKLAGMKTIAKDKLKIGVLYIGSASETSGYTYAHEIGIQGMANNIGLDESQIVRKGKISTTVTKKQ